MVNNLLDYCYLIERGAVKNDQEKGELVAVNGRRHLGIFLYFCKNGIKCRYALWNAQCRSWDDLCSGLHNIFLSAITADDQIWF